ncbi:MAG: murein L,D-transpeptidase catalytic domain family protein [Pseudobdellovibrio sp.]
MVKRLNINLKRVIHFYTAVIMLMFAFSSCAKYAAQGILPDDPDNEPLAIAEKNRSNHESLFEDDGNKSLVSENDKENILPKKTEANNDAKANLEYTSVEEENTEKDEDNLAHLDDEKEDEPQEKTMLGKLIDFITPKKDDTKQKAETKTKDNVSPKIETKTLNVPAIDNEKITVVDKASDYVNQVVRLGYPFKEPKYTVAQQKTVQELYKNIDKDKIIRPELLKRALLAYYHNQKLIKNNKYLTIIDMKIRSNKKRMFIINMSNGQVMSYHVSHGKGSDRNHDGYADQFSNKTGSNATSLGFYLVSETYKGKHGLSVKMDGLSHTNSKARPRAIVIHGANYVQDRNVIQGRSWGCPAVSQKYAKQIINQLKGKSLLFIAN